MESKKYIRKAIVGIMLTAYVFGILKPLSPLLNDIFCHAFDKANHIATIHLENGKYHVHKEISAEIKNDVHQQKNIPDFSSEELLSLHLNSNPFYFSPSLNKTSVMYNKIGIRFSNAFSKTFNPPPRA